MKQLPQPMNPLEEKLRKALMQWMDGKITDEEFGILIDQCKKELGEEFVESILSGSSAAETPINHAEEFDKYNKLERHANEEWAKISKDYKFENEKLIGKYLVAYLKMEYFVNTLIKEEFQHRGYWVIQSRLKLSFPVKLDLLRIEGREYIEYLALAEELNLIRNKLAHDLKFDLLKHTTPEISKFIKPEWDFTLEQKFDLLIDLIQLCCYYFQVETKDMRKKADELFNDENNSQ